MSKDTMIVKVTGINSKLKPPFSKFNSGSLMVDDATKETLELKTNWLNVAKKVAIDGFERDCAYEVEITTNDGGYKTVTGNLTNAEDTPKAEAPKPKPVAKKTEEKPTAEYWEAKERKIQMGGASHDAEGLVNAMFLSGKKIEDVLDIHKKMLIGVLKNFEDVQK